MDLTLDEVDLCKENNVIRFAYLLIRLMPFNPLMWPFKKKNPLKIIFPNPFVLYVTKRNFTVTKREFSKVVKTRFAFSIPKLKLVLLNVAFIR